MFSVLYLMAGSGVERSGINLSMVVTPACSRSDRSECVPGEALPRCSNTGPVVRSKPGRPSGN